MVQLLTTKPTSQPTQHSLTYHGGMLEPLAIQNAIWIFLSRSPLYLFFTYWLLEFHIKTLFVCKNIGKNCFIINMQALTPMWQWPWQRLYLGNFFISQLHKAPFSVFVISHRLQTFSSLVKELCRAPHTAPISTPPRTFSLDTCCIVQLFWWPSVSYPDKTVAFEAAVD